MTLTATMLSTVDLGLYLFSSACTSQLSSCACVSDNAFANQPETITEIQAVPGVDYYLVVDGYLDPMLGGSPTQGAFDLTILRKGCGNTVTESGETCDDGNTEDCDGCRADCSAVETGCGDGFVCDTEECDDGNGGSGDGCSASCAEEPGSEPVDAGETVEPDASTSNPSGGTSGGGGAGNEAGSDGNEPGTGNEAGSNSADAGPNNNSGAGGSNAGGSGIGNPGKGGNRAGAGGTSSGQGNPAASEDQSGGGCNAARHPASSTSAWVALLSMLVLVATRRRSVFGLGALSVLLVGCGISPDPKPRESTESQSLQPRVIQSALTGADTCEEAPLTADSLDEPLIIADTTVGETDDIDLPDDITDPTCTAAPLCVGTGTTTGTRGTIWPGCGTGPDKAYRFQVNAACELTVTLAPDAVDLGVYLFSSACSNELSACACISDNGLAGQPETITSIQAEPGVNYYLLVDGYQNPPPATEPPSAGSYTLTLTRTSGTCNFVSNCGNDAVEVGEDCDDGNTVSGDGCSETCSNESSTPVDSGTASVDAQVPAEGGSTSSGGEANVDSGSAGMSGGSLEADGSVGGTGGQPSSNTGKGQVKGGGGTTSAAGTSAAPTNAADDSGGGCALAEPASLSNDAGLAGLLGLLVLRAIRRRTRRPA
jgi:cysteine-rich repeat protein